MTGNQMNSDDDMTDLDDLNESFDEFDEDEELDLGFGENDETPDNSQSAYSAGDESDSEVEHKPFDTEDEMPTNESVESEEEAGFFLHESETSTDQDFEKAMEGVTETDKASNQDSTNKRQGIARHLLWATAAVIGTTVCAGAILMSFQGASTSGEIVDARESTQSWDSSPQADGLAFGGSTTEANAVVDPSDGAGSQENASLFANERISRSNASSVDHALAQLNRSQQYPSPSEQEAMIAGDQMLLSDTPENNEAFDPDDFKQSLMNEMRSLLSESAGDERRASNQDSQIMDALSSLQREVSALKSSTEARKVADQQSTDSSSGGRQRLKGFHVINTTEDGTMSVVETPSGRINVYFEGEVFNVDGAPMTVSQIDQEGMLVLVGSDYFIDSVREPKPSVRAQQIPDSNAAGNESQVNTSANNPADHNRIYSYEGSTQSVTRAPSNSSIVMEPQIATGWNLNANMAQGYLVKGPRGEFQLVQQGDRIEGLGIVDGLDNNGFLRVGMYKIPRG